MEKIINSVASDQFKEDYVRYAVYVMYSRVTPDYRDGLKPIHRRILWAMYHNSGAINHTVKSATVVGDVIGKWHPHGDAAAYGAIKPLTNWFECKVPLVDKQGNFGNLQGKGASASRYTECKLSKFALECVIGDLRDSKECVDWTPNFDNTDMEPQFLPCAVPLLLVNGTFSIGVGKKPQIPTHNLGEVIDATLALIKDPNTNITLVPDHCMPCEIVETDFNGISRLGFGYYVVRGIIDIEQYGKGHYKNHTALVIKSVPNLIFLNSIVDKIESMISSKKIIQILDMFDESTETEMRHVIILKPGADPNYVRDMIYKNTGIEVRDRVNFEALNGLNPVRMSYKSYLLSFIDHRKLTKFRVFSNRLQTVQTRIFERDAYIKALESGDIDEIIAKIRARRSGIDDDSLIEYLVKKLNITTLQARYIINLPIKNLANGKLPKYKQEMKLLEAKKKEYMDIILSDEKLTQTIIDELLDIKAKYATPRVCRIVSDDGTTEVPKGAMTVVFTEKNFVKKVPFGSPIGNFRGDSARIVINIDNSDNLLIFDSVGKVFKLSVNKIPFGDNKNNGMDIRFLIKELTANISSIIPEYVFRQNNTKNYLITLTRAGLIKKMEFEDFISIPSSGLIYVKLDQGDFVQSVRFGSDMTNALVFSDRKAMVIPITMISTMKRNAKGNKTFRNSIVDGMTIIPNKESANLNTVSLLVITENGRFNKLPVPGLPNLDIPKKPFSVIKLMKDRILDIHIVDENSVVMVKTIMDLHAIPVNAIPSSSTISAGDRVLNTAKDKIIRTYIQQQM